MKKVNSMILVAICITVLISACSKTRDVNDSAILLDKNGVYTGFSDLKISYTAKEAGDEGFYVLQDSEVVANNDKWEKFVNTSLNKVNTYIRIALFYTDNKESPFFLDLYYEDGYYYLFDSSAQNQKKQPYLYLLTLKGQLGNSKRDSGMVVLTDDDKLDFNTVTRAMLSSSMKYQKIVSSFKIVMYK